MEFIKKVCDEFKELCDNSGRFDVEQRNNLFNGIKKIILQADALNEDEQEEFCDTLKEIVLNVEDYDEKDKKYIYLGLKVVTGIASEDEENEYENFESEEVETAPTIYRIIEKNGKVFKAINLDTHEIVSFSTPVPFWEGDLVAYSNEEEQWCKVDEFAELLNSMIIKDLIGEERNEEFNKIFDEACQNIVEESKNRRVLSFDETITFTATRQAAHDAEIKSELEDLED